MKRTLLVFHLLWISACGHLQRSHLDAGEERTLSEKQSETSVDGSSGEKPVVSTEGVVPDFDKSAKESEIPHEVNDLVEKWLAYYQGRGRGHMTRYLERSTRYLPLMKEILASEGLPTDLVYVALIESGFASAAQSRARAVGYWQFIAGTGRLYGLKMGQFIDERRDPILSTQAAAKYLKALYAVFGDWYLAIAAYNSGENRIQRVIMKHYTRDFWSLAKARSLPKETINYVPKYLAARLIAQNPGKYGFRDLDYQPAFEFDEIEVHQSVNLKDLATELGVDYSEIKRLNPAYLRNFAPAIARKALVLRVPQGMKDVSKVAVEKCYMSDRKVVAELEKDFFYYRVHRGDNLGGIARKYRTTIPELCRLNNLSRRSVLRIGQQLQVPIKGEVRVAASSSSPKIKEPAPRRERVASQEEIDQEKRYRVRRGDTLIHIAKKFGVSLINLTQRNQIRKHSRLIAGSTLIIPVID